MLRYAITSRRLFPGEGREQEAALLEQTARWAADGIDFIQLREKDLQAAILAELARSILQQIARSDSPTRLLVSARPDIAIATGAHGVHLTASAGELTPAQVRLLFDAAGLPLPVVTVPCHTLPEIARARDSQADAILFAPVFEKPLSGRQPLPGQGLDRLREACLAAASTPVFALGGVTLENTPACLDAGAAGVAGIRLFYA